MRIEKKGKVWTVIHSRVEARNAMDPESADALVEAFTAFDRDRDAAVAVLWGEGGAFCAGWDLKYCASLVQDAKALHSIDYPLLRFATGDLSAVLPGTSVCGRTNVRIKGWMGRADQSTKVRAMFVTPRQISEIARRHPEIVRARLVVSGEAGSDEMTLHCEVAGTPAGLRDAIAASIREVTKLRGEATIVPLGTLPNDGKVIDDQRKYG